METQPSAPKLLDIEPIRSAPAWPATWEAIEVIIEKPLRAAMHDLWEKGILSIESSANREDARIGRVFFDIVAHNLSAENQTIAISLGADRKSKRDLEVYQFGLAVNLETQTETIVAWSRGIAAAFKAQEKQ